MPGPARETNREVARQLVASWNEHGETHLPESLLDERAVRFFPHPLGLAARGGRPSPSEIALPREAFPDQRYTEEVVIADDKYAFIGWRMEGSHRGRLYGRRAGRGDRVHVNGADLIRLADGKIVEHWDYYSKARVHALARTGQLDREMQRQLIRDGLMGRNRRTGRRRLD
ncbi:ester cyclase [Nucisporomicrobium flavum]|uniref:ester cyclase n=1 Tax=Nucisporomicrobium flavum TaxID=2785915 RepID=UPI0018F41104|nr:ester cyclase [Nucisporomicrobium flavum]